MAQTQATRDYAVSDNTGQNGPSSELDIYERIVDPDVQDDFLDQINLGTGHYTNREMYQQIQSFYDGMFSEAAFSRLIVDRAIDETKRELALKGWTRTDEEGAPVKTWDGWYSLDEEERDKKSRLAYIEERGDKIWSQLAEKEHLAALEVVSGISSGWTPPHWRIVKMRNEASKSRGARLMDNVFGRVKKLVGNDDKEAKSRLKQLRGSGGGGDV